jgi:hypothetical protein
MARVLMKDHINRVEAEEGKTFCEVLKEFAKGGESKSSTATILDLPQTTFCAWLRRQPAINAEISWPAKGQTNGFYANVATNTPARQAARLRNLALSPSHKTL